jgi:hypothetical protein
MRTALPALLLSLPAVLAAQANRLPPLRESPAASVSLDIGLTNVKIDYHRPAVRGREIWGKLVPYGETWRTGANEPSTITFSGDVKVEGKDVPKGTYAFYTIPNKDSWTAILSKNTKLWGSYGYDAKDDLLRWTVKPEAKEGKGTEYMSFFLIPTGGSSARAELHWEKLRIAFAIEVDVHGAYRKLVLEKIAAAKPEDPKDGVLFFQAAQYYFKQNLEPAQALAWATIACKTWESFWPFELKARIEEKAGKQAEAIADMEKAIALTKTAKNPPPKEYTDNLVKDLAAWKAKK